MSILLTAQDVSAAFGARPLFTGVSFTVSDGERVGLIGPNGAGKSTLLRILAGAMSPDDGSVARQRGLRVGLLEQVPRFEAGATVRATVESAAPDGAADEILAKLSFKRAPSEGSLDLPRRLRRAKPDSVNALNGRAESGVSPETPVASLSGGWKKRVALARELARRPDLLLLDEPTNHLDVESIEWLESLLARPDGPAIITVTHDRLFLQRVANRILELDPRNAGGLLAVDGDYAAYTRVKAEAMHAQERREVVLRNTLRRETEWLRRGAAARTTKQQARIARAGDLAEEVSELRTRNRVGSVGLDFQGTERRPRRLIEARGVGKAYDARPIFSGVDLFIGPGVRIGLLGPNGCGKSTLLRVLLGEEPPSAGTVLRADGLQVAYFEQNREVLDPESTAAQTLSPDGDHVSFRGARVHVRGYLERFLFRPEQADMPVRQLSGGEQSRLLLAKLMLREAQVLVLDEPTNDLDLATLAVLEESLTGFDGAVLLVTHDRYFLDQVATTILAFSPEGQVVPFADVAQWEAWRAVRAAAERPRESASAAAAKAAAPRRKLSYLEQREYDGIEAAIAAAEAALAQARADSEDPAHASNAARLVELLATIDARQADVDRLYARWSDLEAKLSATT